MNHLTMLESTNAIQSLQDVEAVSLMHKFNDHNLRLIDIKEQLRLNMAAVAVNRVHRTALSLAATRFKLGQYDAALSAINESIKAAQNKNDDASVLEGIMWLIQIKTKIGRPDEAQKMARYLICQACRSNKLSLMVQGIL